MDFDDLATRLALPKAKVEYGLGSLLFAMRLGLDTPTWDLIKAGFPSVSELLGRASAASGRTAEVVALTAPGAVRRLLSAAGVADSAVATLAEALRAKLIAILPPDATDRATAALDRALG